MRLAKHDLVAIFAAMGVVFLAVSDGVCQAPSPIAVPAGTVTVSRTTLASIMGRLEALEAKEKTKEEAKGEPAWENVSEEKWKTKFGGRIMGDYVNFAGQDPGNLDRFGDQQDYFEMRRLRFFMEGEGYGVYFYKLQLDFESEGAANFADSAVSMKDAYVGIKDVPWLGTVIFGHAKTPFSLEEYGTSSKYITFMERGLPNIFAPSRKVGIEAFNHIESEAVIWGYGAFFNAISPTEHERVADNQGLYLVGRVATTPYYCAGGRHLLHLGLSGLWANDADNSVRWRSRPETHEEDRFIDTGTIGADDYYTLDFESALVWGPISVQSELFYNRTRAINTDLDFYGAYAYASWFLTGENRVYRRDRGSFSRVKPYTNFWCVRGTDGIDTGWGAWEVAARWSYLDLNDGAGPNGGLMNDLTVGINWYWNPHVRWMLNWIHPFNDYKGASQFGFTNGEADIIAMRGQVDF